MNTIRHNRLSLTRTSAMAALAALVATGSVTLAGPLNPPAGPITSTSKTLTEVEPRVAINATNTPGNVSYVFRITQPGSYYLAGNMSVPSGMSGIEIGTNDVTIDMNGFTITGLAGSLDGIGNTPNTIRRRVTIRNGTVANMGRTGVAVSVLNAASTQCITVAEVNAYGNGEHGIYISDGIVRSCKAHNNALYGIFINGYLASTVSGCHANNNITGMRISRGTIESCTTSSNTSYGIQTDQGVITNCTAVGNAIGFNIEDVLLESCEASGSTQYGVLANGNAVVRNNNVAASSILAGTVGIRTQNMTGTKIEGNRITRHSIAIECSMSGALVIGNSIHVCTTAVNAVSGNRIGSIVAATSSGAINGNSGGGLGTTDPYANIIH